MARAAIAVARIGDERGAKPLVRSLQDDNATIREVALWALGPVGGKEARLELQKILRAGQNSKQQMLAALALGRMADKRAYDELSRALGAAKYHRYSDHLAATVAWSLGVLGDDRAATALIDVLERGPSDAVAMAAWALSQLDAPAARRALWKAHWSGNEMRRAHASRGLLWLARRTAAGDAARSELEERIKLSVSREQRFIDDRNMNFDMRGLFLGLKTDVLNVPSIDPVALLESSESQIVSVALEALDAPEAETQERVLAALASPGAMFGLLSAGELGNDARRATLRRKILGKLHAKLRVVAGSSKAKMVSHVGYALDLLAMLQDKSDTALVTKKTEHPNALVRRKAFAALGKGFASASTATTLTRGFQDTYFGVRAAAAHAARDFPASAPELLPKLEGLLSDDFSLVRIKAAESLGRLGAKRSVAALAELTKDPVVDVRVAALSALGVIGGDEAEGVLAPFRTDTDLRLRLAAGGS